MAAAFLDFDHKQQNSDQLRVFTHHIFITWPPMFSISKLENEALRRDILKISILKTFSVSSR